MGVGRWSVVSGVLDEATETWTDLDDMLAAERPCFRCEKTAIVVVRARCLTCPLGARIGLCAWHLKVARAGVNLNSYPDCPACPESGTVRFEGLS